MRRIPYIRGYLLLCVFALALVASDAGANPFSNLTYSLTASMSDLPRYTKLPLFDPHRKSFTCVYQDQHLPPVDPQAELWFQQALALDDPNIYYKDKDWAKIYQLYVKAAERNHWKAMLNLASLILSDYPGVPEQNPEAAIRWVEKAMQLGVPDAWDRMGTYHQSGLVSGGNATTAYAFFQRAADMGSPAAMTFFGDKLGGTYDDPGGDFWGNRPIAIKMLQCAMAQGYGDAAYELGFLQTGDFSAGEKALALKTFQEGVKLGSANCAKNLASEFRGTNLSDGTSLVDRADDARAARYSVLGDALKLYDGRLKLPNLDKVLPLPPAALPKWDGNKQTLIDAAKAVTPVTATPRPASSPSLQGRAFMPDGHGVLPLAQSPYAVPGDQFARENGYWLALYGLPSMTKSQLRPARGGLPEHYRAGEPFEPPGVGWLATEQVQWHFLGEARQLPPAREIFLAQMVNAGLLRQVSPPPALQKCNGLVRCPRTGIWEGRVADDHPLASMYNRWEQQAFVGHGQVFPDPRGRFLDISLEDVHWTYLGSPNADTGTPDVLKIVL